jgi:hypothetical protein
MIDRAKLDDIIAKSRYLWVRKSIGPGGQAALHDLFGELHHIFGLIEPSAYNSLFVLMPVGPSIPRRSLGMFVDVTLGVLAQQVRDGDVMEVLANGLLRVYHPAQVKQAALSRHAILYEYNQRSEYLWAGGSRSAIEKLDPAYDSLFSVPAFSELREAIEYYRTRMARQSSCKILARIWDDERRMFLKAKPESCMRDSLTQHLFGTLRGECEVRPEQIVDESHPVDIKVTWCFTNRLALIEIKWLGDSRRGDGRRATAYRDRRAREGAKQLAEYLDKNKVHAPGHVTRGTLVVFDARRKRIRCKQGEPSRADGLAYAHEEITYSPAYHRTRNDFEEPIRIFLEPVCQ